MYYIHYNPILHSRLQCKQKSRQCCRLTKAHRVSVVLFWDYLFHIYMSEQYLTNICWFFCNRREALWGDSWKSAAGPAQLLHSVDEYARLLTGDTQHSRLQASHPVGGGAHRQQVCHTAGGAVERLGPRRRQIDVIRGSRRWFSISTTASQRCVNFTASVVGMLSSFCTRLRIRIVILYVYVLKKPSNVLSVLVQMVCVHGSSYISQISRNKNFTMQTINCCPKHCVADAVAPPSLRQQYIDN